MDVTTAVNVITAANAIPAAGAMADAMGDVIQHHPAAAEPIIAAAVAVGMATDSGMALDLATDMAAQTGFGSCC